MSNSLEERNEADIPQVSEPHFDTLVDRRQQIKAQLAQLEAECKQIDAELGDILDSNHLKAVIWRADYQVIRTKGMSPRETIDRLKLHELGVSAELIRAATKYGEPGKPGIRVTHIKDKSAEGVM